jgi:hypothetical protein
MEEKEDKIIKIQGENRIIFDGVVRSVAWLLKGGQNKVLPQKELLKRVMTALKTNACIITIYEMVVQQMKEENKKEGTRI